MSGPRSRKRARANTHGDSTLPGSTKDALPAPSIAAPARDIDKVMSIVPDSFVRDCVRDFIASHPESDMALALNAEHDRIMAARAETTVDFDHYSKSVWRMLNVNDSRMSSKQVYAKAASVVSDIMNIVNDIVQGATTEGVSFGTRESAVHTLRKIAKSICLCRPGQFAHEVQRDFSEGEGIAFVDGLKSIIAIMDDGEKDELCDGDDGTFGLKMEELVGLADNHGVFFDLDQVQRMLEEYEEDSDHNAEDDVEEEDDVISVDSCGVPREIHYYR